MTAQIFTSPQAKIAAAIMDRMTAAIGPKLALRWMMQAHPDLGPCCSPLMALKAGREDEVRVLSTAVIGAGKKAA